MPPGFVNLISTYMLVTYIKGLANATVYISRPQGIFLGHSR